jgi:hypothetical protein
VLELRPETHPVQWLHLGRDFALDEELRAMMLGIAGVEEASLQHVMPSLRLVG